MAETGADIKRREEQLRQTIEQLVERLKLRQWAVERAIEIANAPSVMKSPDGSFIGLCEAVYAFVTAPAFNAIANRGEP